MKRRRYRKTPRPLINIRFNSTTVIIITLFLVGLIFGFILSNSLREFDENELIEYVDNGIINIKEIAIYNNEFFLKSILDYIKVILFIWLCGFFSYGYIGVYLVIILKGFLYGFTEAFLTSQYNTGGLILGFISYLPQNLIFIPVLFMLCKSSINNSVKISESQVNPKTNKNFFMEYVLLLMLGIVCYILGTIIETYVTPRIIKYYIDSFM